jgi:hypothetical protein
VRLTEQDKSGFRIAALDAELEGADPAVIWWLAAVAGVPADIDVECPDINDYGQETP